MCVCDCVNVIRVGMEEQQTNRIIDADSNHFSRNITYNRYIAGLKYLDLSNNHLSGEIPDGFMSSINLETLLLDDNDLVGSIPSQVCALRNMGTLKTLTSDCDTNKVVCSCCTNCPNVMPDLTPDDGLTPRQTLLLDKLEQLSGESAVTTQGTVQYKAAQWLIKEDEMDLDANSQNLWQRYTLALLYYMMPDNKKCFHMTTNENECEWAGDSDDTGILWDKIRCDSSQHLNYLKLDKCNLSGPMPLELKSLSKLTYLDLSENYLTGQVPSEYENLHQLEHMYLENNFLHGKVPTEICQLRDNKELQSFATDCVQGNLKVDCDCCTNCPIGNDQSTGGGIGGPGSGSSNLVGLDSRQLAIESKLKQISGDIVAEEGTPQHRAAHFIMKQDAMMLTATSSNLYQRYVITLLGEMGDVNNRCFERRSGISECQWVSKGDSGFTWERIACDPSGFVEYLKLGMYSYCSVMPLLQLLSNYQESHSNLYFR